MVMILSSERQSNLAEDFSDLDSRLSGWMLRKATP